MSVDSEQELPSSTIKTPDFSDEMQALHGGKKDEDSQKAILKAKFSMPELGQFNASLFNVSHHHLDGTYFPMSPVPIVGRIPAETVWDYIDKIKKTKVLIRIR